MAIRMDGKALAEKLRGQIREEAAALPRRPVLAVVLVGEDPASQVYVRNKEKDCVECGIQSQGYRLPAETTEQQLLDLIGTLNESAQVDGILVQLPLPKHISEKKIIWPISMPMQPRSSMAPTLMPLWRQKKNTVRIATMTPP